MNGFDFDEHLRNRKAVIDEALERLLSTFDEPLGRLHEAMRYAVIDGGKRIRPILTLDACYAVGGDDRLALPAACAIELIHSYSLVHDDMPCLDNDDYRRGQPTCHRAFGEAMALLCGDALLTLAFEVLADEQIKAGVPTDVAMEVIRVIAKAAGHLGMVGGQAKDIEAQERLSAGEQLHELELYDIHRRKTGALIAASVEVGAIIGGAFKWQRKALREYGEWIGFAFQVVDDLIDAAGEPKKGKWEPNAVMVLGVDGARHLVNEAVKCALMQLRQFDERAEPLRAFASFLLERLG
ncbi:MAG: hypothetical protein GDYSWBUE_001360 [Candidatus Fervidibacterota bacterium]